MQADEKTETEVKAALQKLIDSYVKRDLQGFLDCFAPDDDVVIYGTGADEKCVGIERIRTQVRRDWEQSESTAMSFSWMPISAAAGVAWAAADGAIEFSTNGQDASIPVRATFVLERRANKWLIVQSHFSMPASGQEEGRSF